MKQELRTGQKKIDLPFSFAVLSEGDKKKEEKQLKRSQCFRGRLVWIKGKNSKRWNLGNIK